MFLFQLRRLKFYFCNFPVYYSLMTFFVEKFEYRFDINGFCIFHQRDYRDERIGFVRLNTEGYVIHSSYIPVIQPQVTFFIVLKVKVGYFICLFSGKYYFAILIFNGHLQCRFGYVRSTVRYDMPCGIFHVHFQD